MKYLYNRTYQTTKNQFIISFINQDFIQLNLQFFKKTFQLL